MYESHSSRKFKKRKVSFRSQEEIEPQEVFLDSLAQKKEEELGVTEKKFEVPVSKKIIQVFWIFSIILIFFLFAKTFQFQIVENKNFVAQAQENKYIISSLRSNRGVVYDSNGEQLVSNKISFNLTADRRSLPESDSDKEKILKDVSGIIKINIEELKNKINGEEGSLVLVSENLDHQTLILLETKIADLPGFEIRENAARDYKNPEFFAHIIGYTGKINAEELKERPDYSGLDYIGRAGLEKEYEDILGKKSGTVQIERDATGKQISKKIISLPESGKSLVLWLDAKLQEKLENELKKMAESLGGKAAAAVAINPKNGGILALVSLPSFDNNLFNPGSDTKMLKILLSDKNQPLFNRAIAGQYATGSAIKPLVASAALEEKIISADKKLDCEGKIIIPNPWDPTLFTIKNDWTTHGWTDMRKAIAESCDVYFYTIGGGYQDQKGLGPSKIKKYLELFGWGEKTGIDLPSENSGFIPSPEWKKETKKENWWDGDTYNMSIGQGDMAVTPLQVATSFAAIANGGTLFQPSMVKETVDSSKNLVEEFLPKIIRQNFISPENLQIVREGMRQTVSGENSPQASALSLNSLPVKAAAKTGTAQTSRVDYCTNWITVFAPYDDPEIVLTIMVENVKNCGTATVPVAKEVLNWYFTKP